MRYEEIVERVRDDFENADARTIYEHCAIQVNVEGEGKGIFYIEIADRKICVEPYDYYDKDGLIITTAQTIIDILEGKISTREAYFSGKLQIKGNMEKVKLLENIVFPKTKNIRLGSQP